MSQLYSAQPQPRPQHTDRADVYYHINSISYVYFVAWSNGNMFSFTVGGLLHCICILNVLCVLFLFTNLLYSDIFPV